MTSEEILSNIHALTQHGYAADGIGIVHQWQYIGHPDPRLMDDKAFEYCKSIGITSLQSYVTWSSIEKSHGVWDFSEYDALVDKIREQGLKWTPFLIAGPYYATPQWFQDSEQNVYARCLEHDRDTRIQSIWNPCLGQHVERFLKAFAAHYDDLSVISSVLLGISGNWGESVYPDSGCFYGEFHTHPGYWCGDSHALQAFRLSMIERYGSLDLLNNAWGSTFADTNEVCMPPIRTGRGEELKRAIIAKIPKSFFLTARKAYWKLLSFQQQRKSFGNNKKDIGSIRRWLDFMDWYTDSMTQYAGYWLSTARRYLPDTRLYLVNGGRGAPMSGADFSAQVKVAAGHGAGIRITNMTDHYDDSFIVTRLTVSAAKYYGTYFSTEEAGVNSAKGVVMRIFDAASTNADEIYFKGLIGAGKCVCTQTDYPVGVPTEGALNFIKYRNLLEGKEPIRKVAIFYPTTAIRLDQSVLKALYLDAITLRQHIDFDFIDEQMIADGALSGVGIMVLAQSGIIQENTLEHMHKWVLSGGELYCNRGIRPLHVLNSDSISLDTKVILLDQVVIYQSITDLISKMHELSNFSLNNTKKCYETNLSESEISYDEVNCRIIKNTNF